jgi:hypothetical protein
VLVVPVPVVVLERVPELVEVPVPVVVLELRAVLPAQEIVARMFVPVVLMVLVVLVVLWLGVLVVLVVVLGSVLVVVRLRGRGGDRRLEGGDQRRGKAHHGHALEEGPACVIGRGTGYGLVAHVLLLSGFGPAGSADTTRISIFAG